MPLELFIIVYACSISLLLPGFFLLMFLSFKHHFNLCFLFSFGLLFPFGQETFPSKKYHFLHVWFHCSPFAKIKLSGRQVLGWLSTNADLTIQYDPHNQSYFQPPQTSLCSTWLISTFRGFVQLLTTLEPFLCFCLNTFNRILDFLQCKNILLRHLP